MKDITNRISQYVERLQYDHLDESVIEQVKLFILDYYAACLAGYRVNTALNEKVFRLLDGMGGSEEATVLFSEKKLPASNAAFLNAIYAHGADMDDGNRKAAGHIGAHMMAAVFAVAQMLHSTWEEVIVAIVAGYDVFNRVVGAAQPGLYNRGFHSTGVGGSIACAAACAKLMGLDSEGVYNAISLGAIQSSGLIIIDESGQGCKPINPANGARTGVISAQLAQMGLESSRNPLESKKGWYNGFADEIDEQVLYDGLGQTYTICESYLKLYPSCRHTHCCIDGAISLREKLLNDGCTHADVEKISVSVYPSAIKSTGAIPYPKTGDEAKFSLHYCLAVALCKGSFGLDDLTVDSSREIQDIIAKIQLVSDASMEDRKAGIRGASLEITTKQGGVYRETVLIPKGEAKKPLSWQDVCNKLVCCAGELCRQDVLERLVADIRTAKPEDAFSMFDIGVGK